MGKAAVAGKAGSGAAGGKPGGAGGPAGKAGAAGDGPGMDKAELKQHFRFAKDNPVQVAFALGGDGKAVLQMHRRKPPRALGAELKEAAPDAKMIRWGTVQVDPSDPKQMLFRVNKSCPGMSRRLVVALKGTGVRKIRLETEDGEVEAHEEADETEQEEADAGPARPGQAATQDGATQGGARPQAANTAATTAAAPEAAPKAAPEMGEQAGGQPEPRGQKAGQPNGAALAQELTELARQLQEAVARDPSRKDALLKLAAAAQSALKGGDLERTAAGIKELRQALEGGATAKPAEPSANGAGDGAADGARSGDGASHPAAPAIAKARAAWAVTRQKVDGEIAKLTKEFETAFADHDSVDELVASFKTRVDTVLHNLDEDLSHKLDEVNKAPDGSQRAKLVDEAHKLIGKYSQHIASDETIKHLDENPLVPMQLGKLLTTTLSTLSKSIR